MLYYICCDFVQAVGYPGHVQHDGYNNTDHKNAKI